MITEEESAVMETARAYCQENLAPRVLEAYRNECRLRGFLTLEPRLTARQPSTRPSCPRWESSVCWEQPLMAMAVLASRPLPTGSLRARSSASIRDTGAP